MSKAMDPAADSPRHALRATLRAMTRSHSVSRIHLPLVRRLAWSVHRRAPHATDLRRARPDRRRRAWWKRRAAGTDRGYAFSTYAQLRIRGAMVDFVRRGATAGARGDRPPPRHRRTVRRQACRASLGATPSDAEVAAAMGMDGSGNGVRWSMRICPADAANRSTLAYSETNSAFADPAESVPTIILVRAEGSALLSCRDRRTSRARGDDPPALFRRGTVARRRSGETLGIGAARVCQIKKRRDRQAARHSLSGMSGTAASTEQAASARVGRAASRSATRQR